ncbi:hypothetical protein KL86DES1_20557 [uncultured Desulfovibrio sp.]|uniref:Uncharacterized protein n=1 Tax=uncultured Desulfovibrio sp. TaxID=167968 RepID=A0A212L491_9BACT|nr:hypothetical protein KL86DES1_20557 [uncultured Desulfovibrio sp.]VZH33461.1 conserved protein of unknown function [Desulfovibrio sp. 86]
MLVPGRQQPACSPFVGEFSGKSLQSG